MRALLAYDGSKGAEEAASLVLAMRWPEGSAVRVVAVVEPSTGLVPGPPLTTVPLVMSPEVESQIIGYLEEQIEGLVGRLRAANLDAEGAVVRGRPATALVEQAQGFDADLVVVGSRGHGPIASLVLGSVSAELADHAPCPVLVARGDATNRVLFATDGSESAARAEAVLVEWPTFADAVVRVLSVAEVVRPWHTGIAPTMYRAAMASYTKDLESARASHDALARDTASRLAAAGRQVDAIVRVGDAAAEIIDEASTWQAGLVVMGSRGLSGLERILLGSVARNVLQESDSSVLIVRRDQTAPRPT